MWDGQSLILGQVRGVPVGIHFTLLLLAVVSEIYWTVHFGFGGIFVGILCILTLWMTVLLHELGHLGMCRRLGGEADRIILWPFGGLAYPKHSGDSGDRIKILLAGPMVHVPLGLLALIFSGIFSDGSALEWYCLWGWRLNLRLFLFNILVPAHPLDMCSILATYLLSIYSTEITAKVFIALGIPSVIILGYIGFSMPEFTSILLALWLFAQTTDLIIRLRSGPAGLAKHPMFTISDQMKPRSKRQQTGVDVSNWDGTAQSWGSGTVGGGPGVVPVVGVPTAGSISQLPVHQGDVVQNPYVGSAIKPDNSLPENQQEESPYVGGAVKPDNSLQGAINNGHANGHGGVPGSGGVPGGINPGMQQGLRSGPPSSNNPTPGGSYGQGGGHTPNNETRGGGHTPYIQETEMQPVPSNAPQTPITGVPPQHFDIGGSEEENVASQGRN